ncbi:hypothetical protein CEDDRAFT_02516 [Frankia sp. CeD]|nr:hypothetical protein CEDDRAFT_02516 [Frankia sp. CeD]
MPPCGDNQKLTTVRVGGWAATPTANDDQPVVPAFIGDGERADYVAGWWAGRQAAALGPLPDELARDVIHIIDGFGRAVARPSQTGSDLNPFGKRLLARNDVDPLDHAGE